MENIENKKGDKMKKMLIASIILLLIIVVLVGCKGKNIKKNEEIIINQAEKDKGVSNNEDKNKDKKKIMVDFKNIVESDNEPFKIVDFIDKNIGNVEEKEAVEMIVDLEQVQKEYIENYTDQLSNKDYQKSLMNLDKKDAIETEDEELKKLLDKVLGGKYKLVNIEGSIYPIIDYEGLRVYNKYLSSNMEDYIEIRSIDSNDPIFLKGGFNVDFTELADRVITIENHIRSYPDSIKKEEILRLYGRYLKLYMEGLDNTEIYNYGTHKIKDKVLESYNATGKIEDTITSIVINKYIHIIEENEFIIDESVFGEVTKLYSEAIGNLEDYKK